MTVYPRMVVTWTPKPGRFRFPSDIALKESGLTTFHCHSFAPWWLLLFIHLHGTVQAFSHFTQEDSEWQSTVLHRGSLSVSALKRDSIQSFGLVSVLILTSLRKSDIRTDCSTFNTVFLCSVSEVSTWFVKLHVRFHHVIYTFPDICILKESVMRALLTISWNSLQFFYRENLSETKRKLDIFCTFCPTIFPN